jgi:hypothetical protein
MSYIVSLSEVYLIEKTFRDLFLLPRLQASVILKGSFVSFLYY